MVARTRKRHEATHDDGRGAQSLDDHTSDDRNRLSAELGGALRTYANRLDPLVACVGSGSPGGGADRAHGVLVADNRRLTIRWSEA